jgi:hypothetical protein
VEFLEHLLLVLHLLGMAALFGGALVQARDAVKVVNVSMLYGALAQVVTGLLLVGVLEGRDEPVDHAKIGVKLAVALIVALLCWANRAKDKIPDGVFFLILLLTTANVVIAVFW